MTRAGSRWQGQYVLTLLIALTLPAATAGTELASAVLTAPVETQIGATIEVTWEGPGEQYDSVYVIAPDAAEDASGIHSASITSGKNPLRVVMPEAPGSYELRYWHRSAKRVAGRKPITVVDVATTLTAPAEVNQGAPIAVTWEGPGNPYDRIELVAADAATDAKPSFSKGILSRANPVSLVAPDAPGAYVLRYRTRLTDRMLAQRPISVVDVPASIEAPNTAVPGSTIEIGWQGPGNDYDLVLLYALGGDGKAVARASILNKRNPTNMRLPEIAGDYELRYTTARSKTVLATRPLTIGSASAALDAPAIGLADTPLAVHWEGPGNNYDQIAIHPADAADDAKALFTRGILSRKNPLTVQLPEASGEYELRYVTARTGQVLARRAITVAPAGRLAVVFERTNQTMSQSTQGVGAVELILDASGSMLQREDGVRRIEIARTVLDELVREQLSDNRDFALRIFGHKAANECRTDLEIPLGPLDRSAAAQRIASINAMNLAKTPIADSLKQIPNDLAKASGPKTIVLITDGEETCDGDPAAVLSELRGAGLDVQVSIVGFAIDDPELKRTFETWAQIGGGSYFDARSAEELTRSLRTVISGPFKVIDGHGATVGQGIVGGA
ncbi:MAG: vWA domain-containing protein, partial [Pseudomonadales bacterium]